MAKNSELNKKNYTTPVLKSFGSVSEVTQAGTGSLFEQNPGQGPTTKRP